MKRNIAARFSACGPLSMTAALLASASAQAATLAAQTCTRGTDVRVIEVVSPGDVGAACDLRYTREAGTNISVPFNASNNTSFCGQRARDLAASLASSGFACTNIGAFDKIASMQEAVDLDAILAGGVPTASTSPAAESAPTLPSADASANAVGPVTLASAPGPIPESTTADITADITASMPATTLSVPPPLVPSADAPINDARQIDAPLADAPAHAAPVLADGAPVSLTPQGATPLKKARYAVGRVVGAAPEDPRPSTLAALGAPSSEGESDAAGREERLASPAAPSVDYAMNATGRPALDAVVATVQSQAAAWNDGDLGAFMNVFWRSPEFTFVSGSTVTKGWDETYRRYRDGYGESGDLGRLSYSNLEAKMLAADTASVVGRYAFARGAASGQGAMTLVMRRFEGAWRVVQHHMVADPAPTAQNAVAPQPPAQAQ